MYVVYSQEISICMYYIYYVCMVCVALCYVVLRFALSCWCCIGDEGGAVVHPDLHGHHLRGLLGARRFR